MSVSFTVSLHELPPFLAVIRASGTINPVQLTGAGWTGEPWPRGLFAKIVDAASAPTKLELTPELEVSFARAGVHGSFIAWTRGAARGVVIGRTNDAVTLHVPVLASAPDYLLAAGLAAAVARLAHTTVVVDDPGQPEGASRRLPPDAVLAQWTATAAETHARQFGTWIVDDVAAGRSYFFQGPHGVIELTQAQLHAIEGEARFERARALLIGEEALRGLSMPAIPPSEDGRREAVLLTAAMVFAAGADGVLAEEEARQLEAHFATVRELGAFAARDLMRAARSEVTGLAALGELGTPLLRRKAFVLAAEVIASARDGKLGGEPSDPNVQAVTALAKALFLDDDQIFLAQVVRTVNTKYEDAHGDDRFAQDLTTAMVLAAAADGRVDEKETAVLSALARTVPDMKRRNIGALFTSARLRIQRDSETALDQITPSAREKCFALATEVALVTGLSPESTLLPKLAIQLGPNRDYADAAIATFAAKYA